MEDFNVIPDYDKLMSSPMSKLTVRVALEILPGLPHTSQNSEDLLEKKALVKQFLEANQLPVEEQGEELVILDSVRLRQDF